MSNKLYDYIVERQSSKIEYSLYNVPIVVKDRLNTDVDIQDLIEDVEERIPSHFFNNIEIIYLGEFPELRGRRESCTWIPNLKISLQKVVV